MDEMSEVIRRKSPREARHPRGGRAVGNFADVCVHRERAQHQRSNEQDVVRERQTACKQIERRDRRRLQEQVVGIRQRPGGWEKNIRVEDAAGQDRGRVVDQRPQIPAQNPEVQVGIAGTLRRSQQRERVTRKAAEVNNSAAAQVDGRCTRSCPLLPGNADAVDFSVA